MAFTCISIKWHHLVFVLAGHKKPAVGLMWAPFRRSLESRQRSVRGMNAGSFPEQRLVMEPTSNMTLFHCTFIALERKFHVN